jgi:hypothetical protein
MNQCGAWWKMTKRRRASRRGPTTPIPTMTEQTTETPWGATTWRRGERLLSVANSRARVKTKLPRKKACILYDEPDDQKLNAKIISTSKKTKGHDKCYFPARIFLHTLPLFHLQYEKKMFINVRLLKDLNKRIEFDQNCTSHNICILMHFLQHDDIAGHVTHAYIYFI